MGYRCSLGTSIPRELRRRDRMTFLPSAPPPPSDPVVAMPPPPGRSSEGGAGARRWKGWSHAPPPAPDGPPWGRTCSALEGVEVEGGGCSGLTPGSEEEEDVAPSEPWGSGGAGWRSDPGPNRWRADSCDEYWETILGEIPNLFLIFAQSQSYLDQSYPREDPVG